jgi:hypothetical protein
MVDLFGLPCHVFIKLLEMLKDLSPFKESWGVTMEEPLAIFLYYRRTNASFDHIADRFNHSTNTVARYV